MSSARLKKFIKNRQIIYVYFTGVVYFLVLFCCYIYLSCLFCLFTLLCCCCFCCLHHQVSQCRQLKDSCGSLLFEGWYFSTKIVELFCFCIEFHVFTCINIFGFNTTHIMSITWFSTTITYLCIYASEVLYTK